MCVNPQNQVAENLSVEQEAIGSENRRMLRNVLSDMQRGTYDLETTHRLISKLINAAMNRKQ